MRIAVIGHEPDSFLVSHYNPSSVIRIADNVVGALKREYGDDLCFSLGGAIGTDQWVGASCIESNVRFHLYLPFHPSIQVKYWQNDQIAELGRQLQRAVGIDIVDPDPEAKYNPSRFQERNIRMVDNADFVVAFWVGKRKGGTFNTIKYALGKSKFVFNVLDDLRPLFKEDLKTGWTPPTMRKVEDE